MNTDQLIAVLGYTYSPDPAQRQHAEELIKTLPTVVGGPLALLQIVGNQAQSSKEIRQAAAISFKNITKTFWEPYGLRSTADCVPAQAKPELRNALFQVLLAEGDKSVRDLLAESINQICRCDYPERWPQLLPEILSHVQSGEPLRIHNAVLALRQVAKRLEYKNSDKEREPLEVINANALPLLQQLARQLLESNNNSIEAAMILKLCLKVLWSCTQFRIPDRAKTDPDAVLGGWLQIMAAVIAKPLPEASEGIEPLEQPTSPEEREAWPWWKLKKWALQLAARWFHRYGMHQYAEDDMQVFSRYFSAQYAPGLLEPIMSLLALRTQGRFCSERSMHLALTYVESAVQVKETYKLLKPHVEKLLTDVVFPQLCLSDADVDLLENDPIEFLRKMNDFMEDFRSPQMAASTLLESIAKYRGKSHLDKYLGFITANLNEYAAAPPHLKNARKKEGCLMSLQVLAEFLKEKKKYRSQLEPLMVTHIFPEFESPVAFLRARACMSVKDFHDIDFQNKANVQTLLQACLQRIRDPSLPVQVQAAEGLQHLIALDGTEELLLPVLPDLLQEFFRIMGELGQDTIVSALQVIIDKFGDQIVPHAAVLVQKLCESFVNYANDGANDDDEAVMAAQQCLDACVTVLHTIAESPSRMQLFQQVQGHVCQVMASILNGSDDFIEYLDVGLEIITFVTYFANGSDADGKVLMNPNPMEVQAAIGPYVQMFPMIVSAFHNYAYDYIPNMMSPIDNMIGYGTDLFLSSSVPETGQSYVQLVLGMAQKVFSMSGVRSVNKEAICATHLLLSLLHNCKGRIDPFIPDILNLVLQRLNPQPTEKLVPVRIPEGCVAGAAIPVSYGGMNLSTVCPAGASPGTEHNLPITLPPEECGDKLKSALLQVISSAFFYNPALVLSHLNSMEGLVQKLLEFWIQTIDQKAKEWPSLPAKLSALGLSAIINLPVGQLPPFVKNNMPQIVARCITLTKELDDAYQEEEKEKDEDRSDDEAEEDEEEEEEDDDEDDEEAGDDDAVDHADIEYIKSLKSEYSKMSYFAAKEDSDDDNFYDDDDEYSSPIDDVDELLYFMQSLQAASNTDPQFYGAVQQALPAETQQMYGALVQRAQIKAQQKQ